MTGILFLLDQLGVETQALRARVATLDEAENDRLRSILGDERPTE